MIKLCIAFFPCDSSYIHYCYTFFLQPVTHLTDWRLVFWIWDFSITIIGLEAITKNRELTPSNEYTSSQRAMRLLVAVAVQNNRSSEEHSQDTAEVFIRIQRESSFKKHVFTNASFYTEKQSPSVLYSLPKYTQ